MTIALRPQTRIPGVSVQVATETMDISAIDDVATTIFDSPARIIECTGAGNLVFTLAGDDTATAALKRTKALLVGDVMRDYAIGKIWLTGTTATVLASR